MASLWILKGSVFDYNLPESFVSQNIQLKHILTKQCEPKFLITLEVLRILWFLKVPYLKQNKNPIYHK